MGVARIPKGFNEVKDIKRIDDRTIRLVGNKRHNVDVPAQLGFLETASLEGLIE